MHVFAKALPAQFSSSVFHVAPYCGEPRPENTFAVTFEKDSQGISRPDSRPNNPFFSMAALQNIVVEGVATFASLPVTSYRYVIELKSDKFKGDMAKAAYISSANAIPDAAAADYVQCFRDSLNGDIDNSSDVQRSLSALSGGGLRLMLAVTLRVLRATWVAKYSFDLDPVSVKRIDVLESKLRDQQEELEKLREGGQSGQAPPYVNAMATEKYGSSTVCWGAVEPNKPVSIGLDGVVKILLGGVYSICATVNTSPEYDHGIKLQKNGKLIQATYPGYSEGYKSSACLNAVERLEKNDALTVSSTCAIVDTSYLYIMRLGD